MVQAILRRGRGGVVRSFCIGDHRVMARAHGLRAIGTVMRTGLRRSDHRRSRAKRRQKDSDQAKAKQGAQNPHDRSMARDGAAVR